MMRSGLCWGVTCWRPRSKRAPHRVSATTCDTRTHIHALAHTRTHARTAALETSSRNEMWRNGVTAQVDASPRMRAETADPVGAHALRHKALSLPPGARRSRTWNSNALVLDHVRCPTDQWCKIETDSHREPTANGQCVLDRAIGARVCRHPWSRFGSHTR